MVRASRSVALPGQLAMALGGLVAYGYDFSRENIFNQMPAVLALLDPSLYQQDFYVQEMVQFTPRSYYYYLIAGPVKLGLPLTAVCFVYFAIAFASFSLGLYAIGRYLGQSRLSAAILAFLGLAVADGTVGYTSLFRRAPIPSVYAIAVAVWGIYYCLKHRWVIGYGLFGLSCLLQFLIGVLPGLLFTPALCCYSLRSRQPARAMAAWLALLGLAIGLVYLPMALSGNTSSSLLGDREFVWLYGYVRHPHHLILSVFSVGSWRRFLFFVAAGLICLWSSRQLQREKKLTIGLTIATGCVLLAIGYVFVEVYPVALVAKLQLARTTPFILLLCLAAIAAYASERYEGQPLLTFGLIAMPVVDNAGGLLTLLIAIGAVAQPVPLRWRSLLSKTLSGRKARAIGYGLLVVLLLVTYNYHLALLLSFAYPWLMDQRPDWAPALLRAAYGITAVSAIFVCLQLGGLVPNRSLSPLHRALKLSPQTDTPVKLLATHLKEHSPVDSLVLVPPGDRVFRFYSQRSVVVNFKGFPFTDAGMVTWAERMENLLGDLPASVESTMAADFQNRSGKELGAIARQYGATHILSSRAWHADVAGQIVAQQGDWVLWSLTKPGVAQNLTGPGPNVDTLYRASGTAAASRLQLGPEPGSATANR